MAQFFDFEEDYFGLTSSDVEKNLSLYGLNTYKKESKTDNGFLYREVLLSPAVILMFAAGVLCFFAANIGAGIAAILLDGLYVAAEMYCRKSCDERLREIKESSVTKFRVIRNGRLELIEKKYIVPEDLIVVQAGERVPADAFILEAQDLSADERILNGSVAAAAKYVGAISENELKPSFVYSGTTILTGIAVCRVTATGVDTKMYQMLGYAPDRHSYFTTLEKVVRATVLAASAIALVLTLVSFLARSINGGDLVFSAISGISLGLCFIPTAIGAVIRLYYTKGAMDLLKGGAVVKSFSDIEKLNSLSVLCVEKEGAISKNRLEVRGIYARSEELLYKVAALACEPNSQDPAVKALMVKAAFFDEKIKNVYDENTFIERLAESNENLSGAIWDVGGEKLCCIKGVPEQILPMCKMSGDALYSAKKRCEDYYSKGCSVMAVACVDAQAEAKDITAGFSYTFIGFAAFSAPLRDSVSAAVKTCRRAGVRVVMLTEENPSVAESTGKMIGISGRGVVTGKQIDACLKNNEELDLNADIYAKITSEQKLFIIKQLQERGEVVAMTGTRAEDADILDAADVGVTISQYAAESSLEAADIIMNDDNFSTLADTIAQARQVHKNIKRAVSVMISGYAALITLMIINLFSGTALMLTPSVIALITLLLLPLTALGFIGNNSDIKSSMPPSEFMIKRKLNLRFIGGAALFGALSGAISAAAYMFMYNGSNSDFARSCALITFCISNAGFVLLRHITDMHFKSFLDSSLIAKISVGVCAVLPILLVYIPFVNKAFRLEAVDILALFISIITGIIPAAAYFLVKHFFKLRELL